MNPTAAVKPKAAARANLKFRIMKRIFGLWFLRSMVPLLIVEIVGIMLGIYLFAKLIFVNAVISNTLNAALGNPFKMIAYLWEAFLGTRGEVKALLITMGLTGLLLLRDLNRGLISYILLRRSQIK